MEPKNQVLLPCRKRHLGYSTNRICGVWHRVRSQAARAASPGRSTWGPRRGRRAAALGSWRRGWAQRQAGRSAHDRGWVGQGRAPCLGLLQRAADATAGPRHTRPRGSQGAHAGPRGGKMRAILRRIQRAYFRRHLRTGSRATPVAVRLEHARRMNGRVFHTKTFATCAGSHSSQ